MSSFPSRLSRHLSVRAQDSDGFTLIEILVALLLFAIISMSLVPLLASGLKASYLTKLSTEAKNLTVARISAMRALPYHVAFQNGPFVDLLDEYYTNANTSGTTPIPDTGGTGQYVASGAIPGQAGAGSYYQVSFASPPEPAGFSQTVYTQFVVPDSETSTSTGDTVISPPSTYNSQATGTDSPPSLAVAVTVVTNFQAGGNAHSDRATTQIADTGHNAPLVIAQAGGDALTFSTGASDGTELSGNLTQVGVNGSLANESTASASVLGGQFSRIDPTGATSYPQTLGADPSPAVAPPDPAGTPGSGTGANASSCTWNYLGPTSYSNLTATVANAQPRAPYDIEAAGDSVNAILNSDGQGGCSGTQFARNAFAFTNAVNTGDTTTPAMDIPAGEPMVSIPDASSFGAPLVTTSAKLDTPALSFSSTGQVANPVTSAATVSYNEPIVLFPGMTSFVSAATVSCGTGCTLPTENGLIVVDLTSVQVSCSSQSSASGQYTGTLYVWEQSSPTSAGAYVSSPFNWSTSSTTAPTLPSLSTTVGYSGTGTPVPLSTYVSSWDAGTLIQQSGSSAGDQIIPGALAINTQPTLTSGGAPIAGSVIDMQIGRVSCVSQDNR